MGSGGERRALKFRTLDEVVDDVRRLQANGYTSVGKWNLGQMAAHMSDWASFPMDGFPKAPFFVRGFLWILKQAWGKRKFRSMLAAGVMESGSPTMPETVYTPSDNEAEMVDKFIKTVRRLQTYTGEVHPSPVFGPMNRDELIQLQLLHMALHLSFLKPKSSE